VQVSGHGQKLSRKQESLIAALLTSSSVAQAAEQVGIAESTAHRWLKDVAFQEAYREARRDVVQQAIGQLQNVCWVAVRTSLMIMANEKAPASARVSAARTVLEMSIKAVELEYIEQRLSALEAHMQKGT
jgi:hypothetical protein